MVKKACGFITYIKAGLKFIAAFLTGSIELLEVRSSVLPLVSSLYVLLYLFLKVLSASKVSRIPLTCFLYVFHPSGRNRLLKI